MEKKVFVVVGSNSLLGGLFTWAFSTRELAEEFRTSSDCQSMCDDTAIHELTVDEKAAAVKGA
jgi:hypothetical protein